MDSRQSDYNYELFFNLSPDLVCIAGFDGYFKRVNPAVCRVLGYTVEELMARPVNDFVFEDDKNVTNTARDNLRESIPLLNFENRYVTKNGEIVWLAWTSQPVMDQKLVFAIAKDITHKKRLELERHALLENLTSVNRELKQFNLSASHDLRSPLSSLSAVFELLDLSSSNRETSELIEILKQTGASLKDTLNNYVDVLSEQVSDRNLLQEVNVEECLQKVLQSIPSLIDMSEATVHTDFSRGNRILFNELYLESVFLNLITNAIKYSRPGHPPVIHISLKVHEKGHQLTVTDNGSGFDMEQVGDRVFGLNETFHDHPDSKGVGLYLVHQHITSLGGKIEVESIVNEGTVFILHFNGGRTYSERDGL